MPGPAPYPADLYAALHTGTEGDLQWYRRQCEAAQSVLELGCGYGRVLAALARPGLQLWGLEIDPALIELARRRVAALPASAREQLRIVTGDMRRFDLHRTFDRILIPHSGLYCLMSDEDVLACLDTARRHLSSGGTILIDAYAADEFHHTSSAADLSAQDLVPVTAVEARGTRWQVFERSRWDRDQQRIDATYLYIDPDGRTQEGTIPQRYLMVEQVQRLLSKSGLELQRLSGDFSGKPWELGDELWVAEVVVPTGKERAR